MRVHNGGGFPTADEGNLLWKEVFFLKQYVSCEEWHIFKSPPFATSWPQFLARFP